MGTIRKVSISIGFVGKWKPFGVQGCETGSMETQSSPVVAAFDLDGTLTGGGSVFDWLKSIAGRGRTWRAALSLAVPLTIGALRSSRWADNAKERLFKKLLAGIDEQVVIAASRTFAVHHLETESRQLLLDRLAWPPRPGPRRRHRLGVAPGVRRRDDRTARSPGRSRDATRGRSAGPPHRRVPRQELSRYREVAPARRVGAESPLPTPPVIFAYGNSRGDRRMLRGATYPFNVGKLGRLGSLRRFPRLKATPEEAALNEA